jgi:hypothetical protein
LYRQLYPQFIEKIIETKKIDINCRELCRAVAVFRSSKYFSGSLAQWAFIAPKAAKEDEKKA